VDDAADLLTGLTEAQAAAVRSTAAPLCIVAAAGAGKTRVLTRRMAYRIRRGDADARHVLALTFTRKAAVELRDRLRQLGPDEHITAGTFHSVASGQLRRWWADRGVAAPTLLERKARLLGPLAADRPGTAEVPVAELAAHLDWAQARLVAPADLEGAARREGRVLPLPAAELASLYERYQHEKRRRGLVDFDDLLAGCADAIERDPTFAGAQRWRWRHVFVDEFQDLNPLQYRLLRAWLGTSSDLCVVGDPHQAIYGWNGADPRLLGRFGELWPGGEVIRLDANHRCTPQIVAAAARVLGPSARSLTSSQADGTEPGVRPYPSERDEAAGVAAELRAAHDRGVPWTQMAVLTRTNAQLLLLREALVAAAVPTRLAGHTQLLTQPAVRRFLDGVRRQPEIPWQTVRADLRAAAGDERLDDEGRTALSALWNLACDHDGDPGAGGAAAWLAWLPVALAGDAGDGAGPAVTLTSFHRAKGLEWDEVWICGLEQGLVPIGRAVTPAAEEEERRLLYVALTRARRALHCSWARRRTFGGRPVTREPSPWLTLVGGDGLPADPVPVITAEDWRRRLRAQRERLAEGRPVGAASRARWDDPDELLLDALRRWRAGVARASGIPAHVLLHDTTLRALASLTPRTEADLLDVPGLGPVKAQRYGPALLSMIAERAATG